MVSSEAMRMSLLGAASTPALSATLTWRVVKVVCDGGRLMRLSMGSRLSAESPPLYQRVRSALVELRRLPFVAAKVPPSSEIVAAPRVLLVLLPRARRTPEPTETVLPATRLEAALVSSMLNVAEPVLLSLVIPPESTPALVSTPVLTVIMPVPLVPLKLTGPFPVVLRVDPALILRAPKLALLASTLTVELVPAATSTVVEAYLAWYCSF